VEGRRAGDVHDLPSNEAESRHALPAYGPDVLVPQRVPRRSRRRAGHGYTPVDEACPAQPVADGDPCPCGEGNRQHTPCSWTCTEGYTRTAACDPMTLRWTVTAGRSTCTL
jgi:hypothetical protein